MFGRDITLKTVKIKDLRPTQMTVGYREVQAKRRRWKALRQAKEGSYIEEHMIPVVHGPRDKFYVIDHHHLAKALSEEGVDGVLTTTLADLRHLSKTAFWAFMDDRGWCRPYDENGVRRDYADMPKDLEDLRDDPYRSLAGELRRLGGYAKDTTPFSEFIWADFYREKLTPKALDKDFDGALAQALKLARTPEASYLPGWCGPCD